MRRSMSFADSDLDVRRKENVGSAIVCRTFMRKPDDTTTDTTPDQSDVHDGVELRFIDHRPVTMYFNRAAIPETEPQWDACNEAGDQESAGWVYATRAEAEMLDLMRSHGWTAEYFLEVVNRAKMEGAAASVGENDFIDLSELDSLVSLDSIQERERVNSLEDALSLASDDGDSNEGESDGEDAFEEEFGLQSLTLAELSYDDAMNGSFVIDGEIKFCVGVPPPSKYLAIDQLCEAHRWHPKKTATILELIVPSKNFQQNDILRKVNRALSVNLRWTTVVDEIAVPSSFVADIQSVSMMGKSTFQKKLLISELNQIIKSQKASYIGALSKITKQTTKQLSTTFCGCSALSQHDIASATSVSTAALEPLLTKSTPSVSVLQSSAKSLQKGAAVVGKVRAATLTSGKVTITSCVSGEKGSPAKVHCTNDPIFSSSMKYDSIIKIQESSNGSTTLSEKSNHSEEKAGRGTVPSSNSPVKPQRSIIATRIQFQS